MRPHDLAIVHSGGALDYLQLARAISLLAQRLRSENIARGMTVAVYVSDPFVHLALLLAAMLNGTVTISAHPNYDPVPPGANIDAYLADKTLPFSTPARVVAIGASLFSNGED